MNSSILIDTNILIYAIDADSRFHNSALELLLDPTLNLFTTSKNLSEFLVVLTRNKEIELSTTECFELLNSLLTDIIILYPNHTTFKIFQDLIRKYNPRGLWIHDVEIASIGLAYGISTIATKNISDFKRITEIKVIEI
jgi:predicted nucleic acid-binding protein